MTATTSALPAGAPMIRISAGAAGFAAGWAHCDQMSTYLAAALTLEKPDPFLYSNMLSTVLNEVLETVFWNHDKGSDVRCTILDNHGEIIIECELSVNDAQRGFYHGVMEQLRSTEAPALYEKTLLGEGGDPAALGFFELVADYGCTISARDQGDRLHLMVRLNLDEQLKSLR